MNTHFNVSDQELAAVTGGSAFRSIKEAIRVSATTADKFYPSNTSLLPIEECPMR